MTASGIPDRRLLGAPGFLPGSAQQKRRKAGGRTVRFSPHQKSARWKFSPLHARAWKTRIVRPVSWLQIILLPDLPALLAVAFSVSSLLQWRGRSGLAPDSRTPNDNRLSYCGQIITRDRRTSRSKERERREPMSFESFFFSRSLEQGATSGRRRVCPEGRRTRWCVGVLGESR